MIKVTTAQNLRDSAGVGSIKNIRKPGKRHEGTVKRPAESRNLDNITAKDIGTSRQLESPMNNPDFGVSKR